MSTPAAHSFRTRLFEHNRPQTSCWYHFDPPHDPPAAAEAHIRHLERFDLDFLKVMFEYGYPRTGLGPSGIVRTTADLARLRPQPGDGPPLDRQLDLLRRLRARLGPDAPLTTTIFHAWVELRNLVAPPRMQHRPPVLDVAGDPRDAALTALLHEDRCAVVTALHTIGHTLADFARACLAAGADGIFLATRDDWVDTPQNRAALLLDDDQSVYDQVVADTDRIILAGAAAGWFNVLHACGRPLNLLRHADNPHVHVLHWADRVAGPTLAEARQALEARRGIEAARRLALAGGVDNLRTLPRGRPEDVAAEVRAACAACAGRPAIIAPGCTYDPRAVPEENIRALRSAVREASA